MAAASALTIAVVIFSFEAVVAARYEGRVDEFATDSGLLPYLFGCLSALPVIGAVLLWATPRQLTGFSGSYAAAVGGTSLFLIIILIARSLRAINPETFQQRRLDRYIREATYDAERQAFNGIAHAILSQETGAIGATLNPFAPSHLRTSVVADRSGIVRDIRLDVMRDLGQRGVPDLWMHVTIGDDVAIGRAIVSSQGGTNSDIDVMKRLVRLS